MSPELEIILKQRIELGYNTPLTAIESPKYSESPELFNNNWFIDAADTDISFVNEFEERSDMKIFSFSGNAYDIVSIYAKKMENFNKIPDSKEMREALLRMDPHYGAMGKMTIDSKGNFLTEAIKMEMIEGVPVKV